MILLRRRSGGVKFYTMDNLPKFARFGRGGCLRRRGKDEYWRDGGAWAVSVKIVKGNVFSVSHVNSVNGLLMEEVTEKEWRNCNGQYAPSNI